MISHVTGERALLAEALSAKSGRKIEVSVPQRGEKKDLIEHALANAREALARKLPKRLPNASSLTALGAALGPVTHPAAYRGL